MDRPLMFGGEVREHQPALPARQTPLRDEAIVTLDAHLAGQVDPKRLQRPSNDAPTAGAYYPAGEEVGACNTGSSASAAGPRREPRTNSSNSPSSTAGRSTSWRSRPSRRGPNSGR